MDKSGGCECGTPENELTHSDIRALDIFYALRKLKPGAGKRQAAPRHHTIPIYISFLLFFYSLFLLFRIPDDIQTEGQEWREEKRARSLLSDTKEE